jgi:drug/metabolite transporter (DMT)-like permease
MANVAKTLDARDWSLLVLLSVLWGGAFFFAGVAVREMPPLTVVFVRVSLAAAALLPLFWTFGHVLPKSFAGWLPFFGMGLLNNVLPFGFIFSGQTQITVGLSSIINALTPLFTVIVMAAFGEERLTRSRVTGVMLGLLGVAVLRGIGGGKDGSQMLGIALCVAGAICYAFAALWGRRQLSGVSPLKSATCQLIAATAMMAVIVSLVDQPWNLPLPGAATVLAIVALALLGTALAYIVFFQILVRAGGGNVMLVTLLIPVSAIMLGYFFLHEPVEARELLGASIIAIGLVFIDGRVFRRGQKRGSDAAKRH